MLCTTYSNGLQPKVGGVLNYRAGEILSRLVKLKACKTFFNKAGTAFPSLRKRCITSFVNLEAAPG
jgi:hypothetical protein